MTGLQIQLSSLRRKQKLLYFLLFSLATVLIWVVLSLFRSQKQPGISPEQQRLAKPFNPNIDVSVIERLEQKTVFQDLELQNFPIYRIVKSKDGKVEQVVPTDLEDEVIDALLNPEDVPFVIPEDRIANPETPAQTDPENNPETNPESEIPTDQTTQAEAPAT